MSASSGTKAYPVVKFVFTSKFIKEVRSLSPEGNHIAIETRERIVTVQYM